ncbi:MAG: hypothetical protein K2I91_04155, partial [Muribaculaceae bacterium]|nr:hypothetical protein [Muribaculaceae bacterium]
MRKYINLFCSLLLLTGVAACSDDFSWNGVEVGEDEYLIAFTAPKPQVELVTGTRADARDNVTDLTLLIFNSNGTLTADPITVYSTDTENFTAPTSETG